MARVGPMPKAEGYSTLCMSIASLYQEQKGTSTSFLALQQDGSRLRASHAALEKQTAALERKNLALAKQNRDLENRLAELLENKIAEVKEGQTSEAKVVQQAIAKRDQQWKAIVHKLVVEKAALTQQVSLSKEELQEASTRADAERKHAILLSKSRDSSESKSKEVQGFISQIKALQTENAQLVHQCA